MTVFEASWDPVEPAETEDELSEESGDDRRSPGFVFFGDKIRGMSAGMRNA